MEDGPARRVGLCPKASSNRFDNGPADRQTNPEAIGLRSKEWLKKLRLIARRKPQPLSDRLKWIDPRRIGCGP